MPSSHLILCRPLLLLSPIPPSIRVFTNESTLHIRGPKYWSFSFIISPSNEHPGLISWEDLMRRCPSTIQDDRAFISLNWLIPCSWTSQPLELYERPDVKPGFRKGRQTRDITLPTKVRLVKAMVFPMVMYGCESWTVKKAERRRIDAFELWCWRRLLRVP